MTYAYINSSRTHTVPPSIAKVPLEVKVASFNGTVIPALIILPADALTAKTAKKSSVCSTNGLALF
jgi:hypothetical protein